MQSSSFPAALCSLLPSAVLLNVDSWIRACTGRRHLPGGYSATIVDHFDFSITVCCHLPWRRIYTLLRVMQLPAGPFAPRLLSQA